MATDQLTDFIAARSDASTGSEMYKRDVKGSELYARPVPGSRGSQAAPSGLGDLFDRGVRAGAAGLSRDVDYFQALLATAVGADEIAANNIQEARAEEANAAAALRNTTGFGDFVDAPTFSEAVNQAALAGGQALPSLVTSLAGFGIGGLTAGAARLGLRKTAKTSVDKIIKDSLERSARGTADADEQALANAIWARRNVPSAEIPIDDMTSALAARRAREAALESRKAFRTSVARGGIAGGLAAEYPPLAGSNLSEALESNKELDKGQAFRAAAVAAPQAAVGVLGEVAIFKLIGNIATKRASKPNSAFGRLGRDIAKGVGLGGAVEAAAEGVQEEIAIQNRSSLDDTFTQEDANLRRAQAVFSGFVAGAGVGGAGGTASGAVGLVKDADVIGTAANVYEKARTLLDKAQTDRATAEIDEEQYGPLSGLATTPEAEADINAQLNALTDPTSAKQAVWIAGTEPKYGTTGGARAGKVQPLEINGQPFYGAFVPGRGTIVAKSPLVVEEVVKSNASDTSLQIALGYSKSKSEVLEGDIVVQVFDAQNNVISEEATDADGLSGALEAAARIQPEGGRIGQTTLEKALEERAARVAREQDPVREMSEDEVFGEFQSEEPDTSWASAFPELVALLQGGERIPLFNRFIGASPRVEGGTVGNGYALKNDPTRLFDNEEAARARVEKIFGEIDWSDDQYSSMSAALLNAVADQDARYPNSVVGVEYDAKADRHYVTRFDPPEGELIRFETRGQRELLPRAEFIKRSITAARASTQRNREGTLTDPDGKESTVNLVDLVNAGRRLIQADGIPWTGDQSGEVDAIKQSLLTILGDLKAEGYSLEVDGFDLTSDPGRFTGNKEGTSSRAKFGPVIAFLSRTGAAIRLEQGHSARSTINPEAIEVPHLVDADGVDLGKLDTLEAQAAVRDASDTLARDEGVAPAQVVQSYLDNPPRDFARRFPQGESESRGRQAEVGRAASAWMQSRLDLALKDLGFNLVPAEDLRNQTELQGKEDLSAEGEGPRDRSDQYARGRYASTRTPFQKNIDDASRLTPQDKDRRIGAGPAQIRRTATTEASRLLTSSEPTQTDLFTRGRVRTPAPVVEATPTTSDTTAAERLEAPRLRARQADLFPSAFGPQPQSTPEPTAAPEPAPARTSLAEIADKLRLRWLSTFSRETVLNFQKAVKFVNPPVVINFEELNANNVNSEIWADLNANYTTGELLRLESSVNRMRDKPGILGLYLRDLNFIILRETGNPVADAYILAHEMGHAFYHQEVEKALDNEALSKRLQKAYEKDPLYAAYEEGYKKRGNGKEEWYADQIARWAVEQYNGQKTAPKNQVEAHFKKLAAKFVALFRRLEATYKNLGKRIGNINKDFDAYMDEIIATRGVAANTRPRTSARTAAEPETATTDFQSYLESIFETNRRENIETGALSMEQKALPRAVRKAVVKEGGEARAAHWRRSLAKVTRPLAKFVGTADSVLRSYAGDELADMFYVRSQQAGTDGRLGMIGEIGVRKNKFLNDFRDQVGELDAPDVQAAFIKAASDDTTAELQGKAKQIRLFLERVHEDYIAPSNTDIARLPNYFPIALDLLAIDAAGDQFVDLLVAESPGLTRAEARKSVENIKRFNQMVADDKPISLITEDEGGFSPTDPSAIAERRRLLTLGVSPSILASQGFLLPPDQAFTAYMHHIVKRVEWNRATDNGVRVNQILENLDPEAKEVALSTIATYLGYQTSPLGPVWRKVNSYGQFFQFVTILPFAAFSSVTDLAGPFVNSKEFNMETFVDGLKQLVYAIKNPEERKQFARDIGLVTNETAANAWVSQAEQDYMDPTIRRASDVWFRMIGLDQLTKFSREFAAGMGVQFIVKHARNEFNNPRAERYLDELGLTAEEVLKWHADGRPLSTPEGKKVAQGVVRFTESSILRPNAAERPLWASDPHWALVWQLKSYFWAYYKVIAGGVFREFKTRAAENPGEQGKLNVAQLTASASVLALTAVATMPLAMLGLELREWAKYGLAWALPGVDASTDYFRSDKMDWGEYLKELIDRSGFLGPLTLFAMADQQMEWGRSGISPILGPTAETMETVWRNGFDVGKTVQDRVIPVWNQL